MREEVKTVHLDAYEEGAVIEGLNRLRTERIEEKKSSDFVSDLMLKIIQTPLKKGKARHEAR